MRRWAITLWTTARLCTNGQMCGDKLSALSDLRVTAWASGNVGELQRPGGSGPHAQNSARIQNSDGVDAERRHQETGAGGAFRGTDEVGATG